MCNSSILSFILLFGWNVGSSSSGSLEKYLFKISAFSLLSDFNSDFLSFVSVFSSVTPFLDFDSVYCHIAFGLFFAFLARLFSYFSGHRYDFIPSSTELLVYFRIF